MGKAYPHSCPVYPLPIHSYLVEMYSFGGKIKSNFIYLFEGPMMRQSLVEMGLNQILVLYILLNTNLQILLPGINTSFGA